MRRGPAAYRVFAKLDQKQDEIFGEPAWKKQPQTEPVHFDVMIPKWAKHHGKGKKSRQDMETKCGVFIEWSIPGHGIEGGNRVGEKPVIGRSSTRRCRRLAAVAGMVGSGEIQNRQRSSRHGIEGPVWTAPAC